ncbi:hypothetical protein N7471_013057 [Penicillium samsonianum]|uniref:uncharacterized protein n=1 Tax=Penicillium samsonianum TaxID=1882272 RepID=UPI0025471547|nr:uncharacterized protein N7471_013057 [Penicillium samsonianum]KAJ6119106.1 hypothetical protein N7471_013057 [Penicillium samsonianum]
MARPRRQSRRQRQGTFHVQVPKLPEDQSLTAKDIPRRGQSCEVRSHPSASMQWNQNDTAAIKQGQPETSTVSLTVSQCMAGGTSTRSSWLSQPVSKRLVKQLIECCRGKIDTIFILQGLNSLLGVPMTNIPFRAQNLILQAIQRYLEFDAFQFVQKWLLEESLVVGWTCPEELELHRLFKFLVEHRDKIRCSSCRQAAITIQKWQRVVSGIRHAAVHRLSQDRESLLHMTRVAIEFSLCIGGLSSVQKLRRLLKFLEDRLPKSERRRTQSRQNFKHQASLPRLRLEGLKDRFLLLPKHTQKVLHRIEAMYNLEVEWFLQSEFR